MLYTMGLLELKELKYTEHFNNALYIVFNEG